MNKNLIDLHVKNKSKNWKYYELLGLQIQKGKKIVVIYSFLFCIDILCVKLDFLKNLMQEAYILGSSC